MRNLPEAIDDLNLVDAMYTRAQASVHAEDLIVYDHGKREEVEHIGEIVPNICVAIFTIAFGIEAVGLRDTSRFMIATNQVDSLRVTELEANEQGYCFDREEAAVNIVTLQMVSPRLVRHACWCWWRSVVLAYQERDNLCLDKILQS